MEGDARLYKKPDEQGVWDEQIATAPGGHVLQSWAWGELKSGFGWQAQRLSVAAASAQVLYRSLPAGMGTLAYIPKGPTVDWQDQRSGQALLEALRPLAQQKRAICLKIEPDLEDDPAHAERLRSMGFRPSPHQVQPRRTILVDLDADSDTILKRMKSKTRYNIRLAGRKGITIREGDQADLPAFYRLMQATGTRDGFGIHSQAYYEAAHHLFVPQDRARLLLAEYEGQILAALVVFALGETACYMYGASSDQHRNRMPTYPLQWQAMQWAKERGCRQYDLWGVPDEEPDALEAQFTERHDGLWGVYRFKRGFGGRVVRTLGAWDMVYAPGRYRLYTMAVNWLNRRQAD
jgi:peptidoglycan pentaglycine glycine transferase (the first glycine)